MLIHCVFCAIRADADRDDLTAVYKDFADLVPVIDGMISFDAGPNRDFEAKTAQFTDGFVVRFANRAAHLAYDVHPLHKAAGVRLVGLCDGGYDGVTVFDLEVPPYQQD